MSTIKNVTIKQYKIDIPIYNQHLYVLDGDPYDIQDYLHNMYDDDFSFDVNSTDAVCLHKGTTSWVWLADQNLNVPTLAHELLHAVLDLAGDIGLDLKDQEALCYLLEFLLRECENIFAIRMDRIKPAITQEAEVPSS